MDKTKDGLLFHRSWRKVLHVNPQKGYSEFRRIIEDKYLSVSTIDLSLTDSIPTDCNLFVIAGPRGTFQDREIALLRNFLNSKGGNLIIALDPVDDHSLVDRPALGLRPLLKEFGIRCHDANLRCNK